MQNPRIFRSGDKTLNSTSYYGKIESIAIPKHYLDEDYNLSGVSDDPIDSLLKSHLNIANNITSIISVNTATLTGTSYSSLDSISGIAPYFIIQNQLTNLTPELFEKKVLIPMGYSIKDFTSSAAFHSFVTGTFIPGTRLNNPTVSLAGVANSHLYLLQNLSWLYLLNTSGGGGYAFEPSSLVTELLTEKIYRGGTVELNDGIKALEEFVWKNYTTCSTWQTLGFIPNNFFSSTGNYTSGTQSLDNLKTLIEVLYSPLFINRKNFKVKDAFELFLDTGSYSPEQTLAAPFSRLLKAFSYSFADINNDIDQLSVLYDLQECPDELLPELAELIGWKLFGFDANRWRLQLYNAVSIYKKTGTKESIQLAVDSLFAKDVFNISGSIYELWESYLPNIALYALATDSSSFESFNTWTPAIARKLGVSGFSQTSMEQNLRLAVDAILLDLVRTFPDHFSVAGKQFPVGSDDFLFDYRGRIFPIPPFEESPYYTNADISPPLIDRFVDDLVCFGISNAFGIQIRDYLLDNSIRAYDDIRSGNGWLLFTSGIQIPPNWDSVTRRLSVKNTEILDIWNNKSSHFKVILESSDFDFTKATFDADSYHAVREASRIITQFSPAHSIPDVRVNANATDEYLKGDYHAPQVGFNPIDGYFVNAVVASALAFSNSEISAVNTRGAYPSATFGRSYADQMTDGPFSTTATLTAYRNANRRRNYKFAMGTTNYYSRTGFNMPLALSPSTLERSLTSSIGFLPLGFIPSALKYQSISDYKNLPDIYSYCQNLNSSAVIYGVPVSATFPCRGNEVLSVSDVYADRSNCPELIQVYHRLKEAEKEILAEKTLNSQVSSIEKNLYWSNPYRGYANSATETLSSEFPSSFLDYERMKFGRGMHKLYSHFLTDFVNHKLTGQIALFNGPNIFAHTFGSILRNSEFDSVTTSYANLVTSSLSAITYLDRNNVFVANTSGTVIANNPSSILVSSTSNTTYRELRNKNLYSGIELIMPSGVSPNSYFSFLEVKNNARNQEDLEYFVNNAMLLIKSISDPIRVKWSIKDTQYSLADGYGVTSNFLLPEHQFEFNYKALAINEAGDRIGGLTVGAWIHTSAEGNHFWTYTPNGWSLCNTTDVTLDKVIQWSHLTKFPEKDVFGNPDVTGVSKFRCLELQTAKGRKVPLANIAERDFTTISVIFNTENKLQELPSEYKKFYGQLHKKAQDYVIELFIVPSSENRDKLLFLDNVNLTDLTLNDMSRFKVEWGTPSKRALISYCPQRFVEVTRDDLLCILLNFRDVTKVLGRSNTSVGGDVLGPLDLLQVSPPSIQDLFGVSGGSRLNFRISPSWVSPVGAGGLTSSINIVN